MRRLAGLIAALAFVPFTVTALPASAATAPAPTTAKPAPIDPQRWENPDHMTWAEYRKVPGTDWENTNLTPTKKKFKGALVVVDYPDKNFVISQPPKSTVFGNPQPAAHDVPRAQVPKFYESFLNHPEPLNNGHTINGYWMEDSGGRFGVQLDAYGAYQLPGKSFEYGMEFQGKADCPPGANCDRDVREDAHKKWIADVGEDKAKQYDFVFYLSAGQDESSTWEEFGQERWLNKEDVPAEFGPGVTGMHNWADTRYVPWTSWQSAASIWPNADIEGHTSVQAESSGQSTYAHEFSHILGILDNYNNPYSVPPRRDYSGPFDMLSRGTFNGPGGPHTRWEIPGTEGSSMGSEHMIRNKIKLGIVDDKNIDKVSRADLDRNGLVVAKITAREVNPLRHGLSGVVVSIGGDKEPACDPKKDPYCDGGGYDNYTLEVVDRMGSDSFQPDHGVLLSKNKDADNAPFDWVIDANPQDIKLVDYKRPDGTDKYVTIGDYRQLDDALFHAGTNSGSQYEYTDKANGLHFYVLGTQRDRSGVLSYTVAIRSADAAKGHHGVRLLPGYPQRGKCTFALLNTGKSQDVYRLTAQNGTLTNALATAGAHRWTTADVYGHGLIRLTATSESDPSKKMTSVCWSH